MKACIYLSFRWRPEIDILTDQLAVLISCQVKKAPIKTTEPKEFSLTKPKPPPLPMPELIPQQEKCKPVSLPLCPIFPLNIATQLVCVCTVFCFFVRGNRYILLTFVLQVPNSTYRAPKEMQKIEEIKKRNQQKTKVQIMSAFTIIVTKSLWRLKDGLLYSCNIQENKFNRRSRCTSTTDVCNS